MPPIKFVLFRFRFHLQGLETKKLGGEKDKLTHKQFIVDMTCVYIPGIDGIPASLKIRQLMGKRPPQRFGKLSLLNSGKKVR